jgi:hypothetical protein
LVIKRNSGGEAETDGVCSDLIAWWQGNICGIDLAGQMHRSLTPPEEASNSRLATLSQKERS